MEQKQKSIRAKAIAKVKELMAALKSKGTADAVAIQLYKEKVRKARCGDAKKCALAQYIANRMPPGVTVLVDGSVALYDTTNGYLDEFYTHPGTKVTTEFINRFDTKEYPFLQRA